MDNQLDNFSLGKATDAVLKLKDDVGRGIIAIGDWIALTRQAIPDTEWLDWLKYAVKIQPITAHRYMKIAKEISYRDLERLGVNKVFEIMELPPGKFRDDLVERGDSMTTQEVRSAVDGAIHQKTDPMFEMGEVVEDEKIEDLPPNIDTFLRINAEWMDELEHLNVQSIPDNYQGLVYSQLSRLVRVVTKFLKDNYGEK